MLEASLETKRYISLNQYAALKGVSLATVKREIRSGAGPEITALSARRKGIRIDRALAHIERGAKQNPLARPTDEISGSDADTSQHQGSNASGIRWSASKSLFSKRKVATP